MTAFEIALLISLHTSVIIGFAVLRGLRGQLVRLERHQAQLMTWVRDKAGGFEAEGNHADFDRAVHDALVSGNKVPSQLSSVSPHGALWRLILGVQPGCRTCSQILADLPGSLPLFSQYCLEVLTPAPIAELPNVIQQTIAADHDLLMGAPFALLVDPDGTIQGNAFLHGATDLADFVSEGHAHGFGPGVQHHMPTKA